MNIKKLILTGLMSICAAATIVSTAPAPALAAESATEATQQASGPVFTYKHTSARYGYSIFCPMQPSVVPASAYNDVDKGDVLIFSGTYDNIKKGWVICRNAYDSSIIPDNLGEMSEEEARNFLAEFSAKYGLAYAQIVEIDTPTESDGTAGQQARYGIVGPTSMQVEIDTDGDGVMDDVATADNQMMKIFVRGQYGGHFVLGLIESEGLKDADVTEFLNAGIYTFQEWPTATIDKAKTEAKNKKK